MFTRKIIDFGTESEKVYLDKMQEAFPNVAARGAINGKHLAVFFQDVLVGGVTLEKHSHLKTDPDLIKYWNIVTDKGGTRMFRLWADKPTALPQIFEGILEICSSNTFLYGILSLPLGFAQKRTFLLADHKGWLEPQVSIKDCHWDPNLTPSSDGSKLLQTYLRVGALPLGLPSGSPGDSSIKVAMGMEWKDVNHYKPSKNYAEADS